jgi:hypothetical protein
VAGQLLQGPDQLRLALHNGERALAGGDAAAGRDWYAIAYRMAEERGDVEAVAIAALGLSGLWLNGEPTATGAAVQRSRLLRALEAVPEDASLVRRLRGRLVAESDFQACTSDTVLALAGEARAAGDRVAWAELSRLALNCLFGPGQSAARAELAQELVTEAARSGGPEEQALGIMWRTVNLIVDGDARAVSSLNELRQVAPSSGHGVVQFVLRAVEVMLGIRAGRLEWAEAEARTCADVGLAIGDPHAPTWYSAHLLAIRWYQGRLGETVPDLVDLTSTEHGRAEHGFTAVLALAAALAGDHRRAAGALARLGGGDLSRLPRTSTWLLSMYCVIEAAALLADAQLARAAYELLAPYAALPLAGGPGIVCFGSVEHALGVACLAWNEPERATSHLRSALRVNHALEHWPAAAMTRWRLAEALHRRGGWEDRAEVRTLRAKAAWEAREWGLRLPDDTAAAARQPSRSKSAARVSFRQRGRRWEVRLDEQSALVRDSRGAQYLAVLTANADQDILAATLSAGLLGGEWSGAAADSAQPVLDDAARRQFRQRLSELDEAIEESSVVGDEQRHDELTREREWLLRELAAATGLGGRAKTFVTNEERARVAVGKAIRRAIDHIGQSNQAIAEHLRQCVQTGRYCVYVPCRRFVRAGFSRPGTGGVMSETA